MTLNDGIMFIMAVGTLIGGADCILCNKFHLGEKFEEGFMSLGPIALSMAGIICLAPKLAEWLSPVILPLYRLIGADPAMFGSILAIDMGGFPMALTLAESPELGYFSGIIVSSMLGATIVFTIPVGFSMMKEAEWEYFAKGLLLGLIPIPVGAFVGGIMMGISPGVVLVNLIPVIGIGFLLVLGLVFVQDKMVRGFIIFGRGVRIVTLIGLTAAAFEYMTGIALIPGMTPIMESMKTVSGIGVVLLGSLPIMTLLLRILKKPFEAMGKRMSLNAVSVAGLLFSCITVLPVFQMIKDMNVRGKIAVTAFMVSTISVFAAHLGFTVGAAPALLVPLISAKLISGVLAVVLTFAVVKPEGQE